MVKAKFKVDGIFGGTIDGAESKRIEMSPVFASEFGKEGNACEENAIFGKYTPAGHISITIVNPAAFEQFEVNKEYYVDFLTLEESGLSKETEEEKIEEQEVEKEDAETMAEIEKADGTEVATAPEQPENTEDHKIAEGETTSEASPAQTV